MSAVLDEDVLATLTDEEREAIESGELSESEQESLKAIAGDDEEDDDDDAAPSAQPIEGKGAADAVEVNDDKPSAGADDTPADVDVSAVKEEGDDRPFRPAYKAELPDDFAEQLAGLDTDLEHLEQQFKDGEIDFDQYRADAKVIDAKRTELNSAKLRADIYTDMTAQNAEQEWSWTVNRFMRVTAKAGEIDYTKDHAKRADLDGFVKALAQVEANADKDYDWFLSEAHRRVKALHGIQTAPAKDGGGSATPPSRKPPTDAAPVTLATVPGSDGPGDLAGEFADLDGLDGEALETAIAKMTPEQREKYARGS